MLNKPVTLLSIVGLLKGDCVYTLRLLRERQYECFEVHVYIVYIR